MNITLVTVAERTREIGIRKALGARRTDISGSSSSESILLTCIGGILGGLSGSHCTIIGIRPVVDPRAVLLAFGVAVLVGVFLALYPANRAASLRPIEALRHE